MGGRIALAGLLALALLALPGWTAGARGASCCGTDCSPCPLSFCKTTRADRALVPAVPALASLPIALVQAPGAARFELGGAPAAPTFSGPASFQPLRN